METIKKFQIFLQNWLNWQILPKKLQESLRQKSVSEKVRFLTLSLALPILVLLGIVLFLFIYRLYDALEIKLRTARNALYSNLEEAGRLAKEYASLLASNPVVIRELLSKIPNSGPLVQVGEGLIRNFGIREVTFIEITGIVIARAHEPNNFGDSLEKQKEVALALEGKTGTFFSGESHPPKLISCVPITYEQEILGGVCVAYVLDELFAKRLLNLTGAHVFFGSEKGISGSSLGSLREGKFPEEKMNFSKKVVFYRGEKKIKTSYLEFFRSELPYELATEKPVYVASALDMSRERTWLNIVVFSMLILTTTIISFAFLISLKVAKNLTTAIAKISSGIGTIAEGNLSIELPVDSQDELGKLAQSVNTMAQKLKQSYEDLEKAKKKIEDYAETLEQKVEDRTLELKKSYEEIKSLKEKQDADYYLTSILTVPLSGIKVNSEVFSIAQITSQKKKFQYRRFSQEIGGDLSAARSIELEKNPYIALINADAMGKSIQGAGGALVLGAAFEALCNRSVRGQNDNRTPEKWLCDSLTELHKLFLSFDGAMMASCCLILAEEKTGTLYWSNAEHPSPVLYRKGKALFLEENQMVRKLGMTGVEFLPTVNVLRLKFGEKVIFGTDGREDLLVSHPSGNKEINEDVNLFLQIVEKAEGNLEKIIRILPQFGEITDDISLLEIELLHTIIPQVETDNLLYEKAKKLVDNKKYHQYQQEFSQNREKWQIQPKLWKLYIRSLALDKKLKEAFQEAYSYICQFPEDTRMLYEALRLAHLAEEQIYTAKLKERLVLRNPGIVLNFSKRDII